MNKTLLFLFSCAILLGCKNKKTALNDGDSVDVAEFIDFFPEVTLPFQLADTSLLGNKSDSSLIGNKIFAQFIPDTVLSKQFGKKAKPKIFPVGKVVVKKNETYLFLKAITPTKRAAYIVVFDNEQKFVVSQLLMASEPNAAITQKATMDNKYTLTTMRTKTASGAEMLYQKDAYVYTSAGVFTLILTESNGLKQVATNVINPLDTLSKKNKYSGDYVKDAKNFVSIRDGKQVGSFLFFIHFEKDGGSCVGELKGIANFKGSNKAVYQQSSGPCVIEFSFNGDRVAIKETGPCGTYRGIKCFFEGSFVKKKLPKTKKTTRKK